MKGVGVAATVGFREPHDIAATITTTTAARKPGVANPVNPLILKNLDSGDSSIF